MKIFYVYAYLNERGIPYYIGKGKNKRYRAKHECIVPPKNRIKFLYKNLSEENACNIESRLIEKYGRKDIDTGILENRSSKGIPTGPRAQMILSHLQKKNWRDINFRKRMSDAMKKAWANNPKRKAGLIKWNKSEEKRSQQSQFNKNRWNDPAQKKKISKKIRETMNSPEFKKKHSERMKAYWAGKKSKA